MATWADISDEQLDAILSTGLTHQAIADMMGVTREAASKQIRAWARDNPEAAARLGPPKHGARADRMVARVLDALEKPHKLNTLGEINAFLDPLTRVVGLIEKLGRLTEADSQIRALRGGSGASNLRAATSLRGSRAA